MKKLSYDSTERRSGRWARFLVALPMAWGPTMMGCNGGMTREEAREAVEEASLATQAAALTSTTAEISTDFTIGEAVENAAASIRDFYEANLPCAEVTLEGATLAVAYGARGGDCLYRGQRFTGTHQVTVTRNDADQVEVDHAWTELANEVVSVTGTAHVTWNGGEDAYRHIEHELEWTNLDSGRVATGTGDRFQRPLDGDVLTGITVDGARHWRGEAGNWHLDIDGVAMRWVDPVPQSGKYVLDTPYDKTLTLTFERKDDDVITVTAASGNRSYDFDVRSIR